MSLTTAAPRQRLIWTMVLNVPSSTTLADAVKKLKSSGDQKWKWAKSPGNGKTHSVFQCNAHEDCDHHRMATKSGDVYVLKECGEHSEELKVKKRKN